MGIWQGESGGQAATLADAGVLARDARDGDDRQVRKRSFVVLLRRTIVNRTYGVHKTLYM